MLTRPLYSRVRCTSNTVRDSFSCDAFRMSVAAHSCLRHHAAGQEAVMKMAAEIHGCPIVGPFALKKESDTVTG